MGTTPVYGTRQVHNLVTNLTNIFRGAHLIGWLSDVNIHEDANIHEVQQMDQTSREAIVV